MGSAKFTFKRNEAIVGILEGGEYLSSYAMGRIKSNPQGSDFGMIQGSIILMALSIELCLKSIIEDFSGSYSKTHSIKVLFSELEETLQATIREEYSSEAKKNNWLDFSDLLNEISSIFVEWRYATMDGGVLNLQMDSWDYFAKLLTKNFNN